MQQVRLVALPMFCSLKGYEKGENTKKDQQLLHHTKAQDKELLHFSTDRAVEHSYHTATLQTPK